MSFFPGAFRHTYPGQAIYWPVTPEPDFALNPNAAGPRRVGVGAIETEPRSILPPQASVNGLGCAGGCGGGCCGSVGVTAEEEYAQTSWGMVAAVGAGSLLTGLVIGWIAKGSQSKKGCGVTPARRGYRFAEA